MVEVTSCGEWVRRARKALDLTQAALAQQVGCATITIGKIERDERRPSRQMAERLAEHLALPDADRETFIRLARGEFVPDATFSRPSVSVTATQPRYEHDEADHLDPINFVGRTRELAQLNTHLLASLQGRGRVVFITGEAGAGKTTLMSEFARRAQTEHSNLFVAGGNCSAFDGVGDPYLPFRDMLALLTGDIDLQWATGTLRAIQTRRLWLLLPTVVETILDHGPDLLDVMVPGDALMQRVRAYSADSDSWAVRLQQIFDRKHEYVSAVAQRQLLDQFTRVLQTIAHKHPLLLMLDDLQWADSASLHLLFHLGRRLNRSPILIVGSYRPSEIALAQTNSESDSSELLQLEPLVHEFKRRFGDIETSLEHVQTEERRAFVDALLDSEPNQLGVRFRDALFNHTKGHALFTTELLREMQARGDLIQNGAEEWVEGPALDWETLPARVEGVIAQRIGRLPDEQYALLKTASVEGEQFTAEVVSRVQGLDEREAIKQLSGSISRQHRLVRAESTQRQGAQRISRYRFAHILFQKYLYHSLDAAERAYLHETVGTAMEAVYAEHIGSVALPLAQHFRRAGLTAKAIKYFTLAGERAVQLSANREAEQLFAQAIQLLHTLPETRKRDEQELALQIARGVPLMIVTGYGRPEVKVVYLRARLLCERLGVRPSGPILRALAVTHVTNSELEEAYDLGTQLLQLAEHEEDERLRVEAEYVLGVTTFWQGDFIAARTHLQEGLTRYRPGRHRSYIARYAQDPGVICGVRHAFTLWCLGYPDTAFACCNAALAHARTLDHPYTLAYALSWASHLARECEDLQQLTPLVEEELSLIREQDLIFWLPAIIVHWGWILAQQQDEQAALAAIDEGMTALRSQGKIPNGPYIRAVAAETLGALDRPQQGLDLLNEALALIEANGERFWQAELLRQKGHLLAQAGAGDAEIEEQFRTAITVARQQQAKSLELRAATSLSRLWLSQGRREEAHRLLAETYTWFTEGFDTQDVKRARTLLAQLV